MKITRRSAVQGLLATGVAAAGTSCTNLPPASQSSLGSTLTQTKIPDSVDSPLFNRENALRVLSAASVDLLLCSDPTNVFYLTNHRIVPNSLGMDGLAYASFQTDGDLAPALITGKFSYYLASDDKTIPSHVRLQLFTSPAEPDLYQALTDPEEIINAPATDGYLTPEFDRHSWRPYERTRRATIEKAAIDATATSDAALLKALRDAPLPNRTVAVDDQRIISVLKRSGLDLNYVDGEQLLRQIRLRKTPAELTYARYAARANAEAGLEAARTVSAGASFQELRAEFASACGKHLSTPVYILIDGHFAPLTQDSFVPGRTFLIDCVSQFEGYHGDYGRTVCVGEPGRDMQKVVDALSSVWDRVLPELKVGATYADIAALGQKLFAETKIDAGLVMGPHAVGLHHTDEPGARQFAPFEKQNLTLEENMVISVDMPVLGSGLGGTAHLEDLVLITKDGPELLNETSDRFIVV